MWCILRVQLIVKTCSTCVIVTSHLCGNVHLTHATNILILVLLVICQLLHTGCSLRKMLSAFAILLSKSSMVPPSSSSLLSTLSLSIYWLVTLKLKSNDISYYWCTKLLFWFLGQQSSLVAHKLMVLLCMLLKQMIFYN